MSLRKKKKAQFLFRGTASAFSARLTQIAKEARVEVVPGLPGSALTIVGGRSTSKTKAGAYLDIFSWKATSTDSLGEQVANNTYRTTVRAELQGFVARNKPVVFEADDLSTEMTAEHRAGRETAFAAPHIGFGGSKGLFLESSPLIVEYDNDISAYPTFSAFEKAYRTDREFFSKHKGLMGAKDARFGSKLPRLESGYVVTSIVKALVWKGKTYEGNSLRVKDFGTLFFGELILNEYNRRLTMCRLDMGCDTEGDGGLVEVDPNGIWVG